MEQLQFKELELNGVAGDGGSGTAGKLMGEPGVATGQAGALGSI